MSACFQELKPQLQNAQTCNLETQLRQKIVGQREAIAEIVNLVQVFRAGLHFKGHPAGNLLFLGPTGCGKTRIVEALAEILFGDSRAVLKVDCAEFQHSHEIAKLIGSPPGYLGHRETHPVITQEALAHFHREGLKLSFLLLDEIEKASDALWQLLLGILDKATLTLGDNRRVDLSQTMIFMTSNLGGSEITELMTGGMGFAPPNAVTNLRGLNESIDRAAVDAARRRFSPEFINRIDRIVVFHPLTPSQMKEVLQIELGAVQERILQAPRGQFAFEVTSAAQDLLLREGTDLRYGARHLKRAIEKFLVYPISNLMASDQIGSGDAISVDFERRTGRLVFLKDAGSALSMAEKASTQPSAIPEVRSGFFARRAQKMRAGLGHADSRGL